MKQWFPEIDILKATAIILIVFCHMDNYVSCYNLIRLIDQYAALVGLSIFFFISGFLLSQTDSVINSINDIKIFLRKKFIRIFPIYWVALASLVIIFGLLQINPGYETIFNFSPKVLLVQFFGLQGIFDGYSLNYLWFVGVIILFYILYPIIAYLSNNSFETLIASSVILILLVIIHIFFGLIHINAFMYYPIFISGILINQIVYSSKKIVDEILLKRILILSIILLFMIIFILVFLKFNNINIFSEILMKGSMIPLCIFYLIFTRLNIKIRKNVMSIISSIAFGTYTIYLFHLQFLAIFTLIIEIFIQNIIFQDVIILTSGIAGAILCGIIIQKIEQYIFMSSSQNDYETNGHRLNQ